MWLKQGVYQFGAEPERIFKKKSWELKVVKI
jgi:hypothetical protein